jgi:glycosyltransferase involved in cell wall biosynthesis
MRRPVSQRLWDEARKLGDRLLDPDGVASDLASLVEKGLATTARHGALETARRATRKLESFVRRRAAIWLAGQRPRGARGERADTLAGLVDQLYTEPGRDYQPRTERAVVDPAVKLVAFYLPQFHPIPENDAWWGAGFTEWTNVTRAAPQFIGHYQPRLPGDLGFYDLRLPEVQERQIELARHYGIYGFCLHYYWFNGRRLLYRPLEQLLQRSELDFPFCICWANEDWTRRWDGHEGEVLIGQHHSPASDAAFIENAAHILRDRRYIRVDGRPLLVVYRPDILPEARTSIMRWREHARKVGLGELYLVAAQTFGFEDPRPLGFDAAVQFPPHGVVLDDHTHTVELTNHRFTGRIYDYSDVVRAKSASAEGDYPLFKTVMPDWDNTARRGAAGHAYVGSTPQRYQAWLEAAAEETIARQPTSDRYVFVNAWNEWAEGAYLEPDQKRGYAYLNATAGALDKARARAHAPGRRQPRISVVIPTYNHERYIAAALRSAAEQKVEDLEVIVVNDGSTDRTAELVRAFAVQHPGLRLDLVEQPNAGAHVALNNGVARARGDYVALLNSDDYYRPGRLAVMMAALEKSSQLLAFSDLDFVDGDDQPLTSEHDFVRTLRRKIDSRSKHPSLAYALLESNIAVTTGNFVFRRELFNMVGGFRELKYCHDWDFVLTTLRFCEPLFVDRRLYTYRLHDRNSFRELQSLAEKETDVVLGRFFAYAQREPVVRAGFPSPLRDGTAFTRFVRNHDYRKYLG